MPRENRKRGKKHKNQPRDEAKPTHEADHHEEEVKQTRGPSWIVERNKYGDDGTEQGRSTDAPFGYVDPDLKAYFKTVDNKLREWQEIDGAERYDDDGENADPNEGA